MKDEQVRELLYQAYETEIGGVDVYTTALRCVENDDLKEEWDKYLEQTKTHVTIVEDVLKKLGLDPKEETPGRKVVRTIGEALVRSEEHTSELQSRFGISYAVFCLKKKKNTKQDAAQRIHTWHYLRTSVVRLP